MRIKLSKKENFIFVKSILQDPFFFFVSLYFILTPIEFIINSFIPGGSSVKYLGAIIIILAVLKLIRSKPRFKIQFNFITLYLWVLFMAISYFWAVSPSGWIFYYKMYQNMVVFYIALMLYQFSDNQIQIIISSYLIGDIILLIYFLLNISLINEEGVRYSFFISGNLYDPNNLAVFFVHGLAISFYQFYIHEIHKLRYFALFMMFLFSMILTGSRGAAISSLTIILIIVMIKIKKVNILKFLKTTTLIVIIFFLISKFIPLELITRIVDVSSYESGSSRLYIWNNSILKLKERLFFGSGIGAISYYGITHNTYITILLETGVVGFILFISSMLSILYEGIKKKKWMGVIILISCLIAAFFLDVLVKRFFWNGIIIASLIAKSNYESKFTTTSILQNKKEQHI